MSSSPALAARETVSRHDIDNDGTFGIVNSICDDESMRYYIAQDFSAPGNYRVQWNGVPGPDGLGGPIGPTASLKGTPIWLIQGETAAPVICGTATGSIKWSTLGGVVVYGPRMADYVTSGWQTFKNALDAIGSIGHILSSTYSRNRVPALAWFSSAEPVNSTNPTGSWSYHYAVVNADAEPHTFGNSLVPAFTGSIPAGEEREYSTTDVPPCGIGIGSFNVTDTSEHFPVTGIVPTGCPVDEGAPDALACVFAGDVGVAPAVDALSNEGSYHFQTVSGTCALMDASDPTEAQSGNVNIASTGEYENLVCGTGTADSEVWDTGNGVVDEDESLWVLGGNPDEHRQEASTPATITYQPGSPLMGPGGELPATINYHIDFFGGVGVISIRDRAVDDTAQVGMRSGHADGTGANGHGAAVLGPPRNGAIGGPDVDDRDCTQGFSVAGWLEADLPDSASGN